MAQVQATASSTTGRPTTTRSRQQRFQQQRFVCGKNPSKLWDGSPRWVPWMPGYNPHAENSGWPGPFREPFPLGYAGNAFPQRLTTKLARALPDAGHSRRGSDPPEQIAAQTRFFNALLFVFDLWANIFYLFGLVGKTLGVLQIPRHSSLSKTGRPPSRPPETLATGIEKTRLW